jgi:glutamate--cysteine ligase
MLKRADLIQRFHEYATPRERWLVGGEFERIALRQDGRSVPYDCSCGIRWILERLAAEHGWEPVLEGEFPIALLKDGASTTLEPGGQVELSGAPHASLLDLAREAWASLGELQSLSEGCDLQWTALGLTPYTPIDQIQWVPKGRYQVMREYLPGRGDLALAMMKGTSSFQANFDFSDEADCAAKLGTMSRLGALTTAIFANSPLLGGKETGWMSYRGEIWTRTDPDRTGFPLAEGYTHEAWVDYLLDVPMMFFKQAGRWAPALGRTFRSWMEEGIDGDYPGWSDWELHQTSVFPEVRVKRTIEIRGADAVPLPLALGGIALWTGLLYDPIALDQAEALSREFAASADAAGRFAVAVRQGLEGDLGGRLLADWARDLAEIAGHGLARSRPDERHLLAPLEAQILTGESPAAAVLRAWREDPKPSVFLKRVAY